MTTLIILNEEIDDIMKIVKFFGKSGLLIIDVSEKNNYVVKNAKKTLYFEEHSKITTKDLIKQQVVMLIQRQYNNLISL